MIGIQTFGVTFHKSDELFLIRRLCKDDTFQGRDVLSEEETEMVYLQ